MGKEETRPRTHVGQWDGGGVFQSDTAPLLGSQGQDGCRRMLRQLKSGMGTKINQPPRSSTYEVTRPHPSLTEIDRNTSPDCNRAWDWSRASPVKGFSCGLKHAPKRSDGSRPASFLLAGLSPAAALQCPAEVWGTQERSMKFCRNVESFMASVKASCLAASLLQPRENNWEVSRLGAELGASGLV